MDFFFLGRSWSSISYGHLIYLLCTVDLFLLNEAGGGKSIPLLTLFFFCRLLFLLKHLIIICFYKWNIYNDYHSKQDATPDQTCNTVIHQISDKERKICRILATGAV